MLYRCCGKVGDYGWETCWVLGGHSIARHAKVWLRNGHLYKGNHHRKENRIVSDFETVGKISDFEDGQGRAVPVDGRMVAVFRTGEEWFAIDDLCPHMGASLAEGYVEDKMVTCPWHAWRFCIRDGKWEDNPRTRVDCFEVKIDGDDVLVREKISAAEE